MKRITPTTICVVVASLAAAGSAAADVHLDPAGHGGRSASSAGPAFASAASLSAGAASAPAMTLGGETRQGQPVVASVSRGRKTVRLNVAFSSRCTSGDPAFATAKFKVATVKKARVSVANTVTMPFDDGYTLVESYRAVARLGKKSMAGRLRVIDDWYAPNGSHEDTCDTGRQRFKLQRTGVFAGTTDDGAPVVLEYTASHDRVKNLMIPWFAECDSGDWLWGTTHLADTPRAGGAFGGTWSKAVSSANGLTATSTYSLGGALLAHSAFGSWSVTTDITDADQNEVDSCGTDLMTFRVK
jgi:hypothetical protein